jgi:Ni,Fe-hydrogenase III large subunit
MAEPMMKYGARQGNMTFLRRWIAKVSARSICIFPIPGADVFRACTNDSGAATYKLAPTPREANVLLVIGKLTTKLVQKAAVAYAQIPRPRVLVFAGAEQLPPLPDPDLQVVLEDDFFEQALPKIQALLKNHAWQKDAVPWKPDFLVNIGSNSDENKHNHHNHKDNSDNHEESERDENNDDENGEDNGGGGMDMDFMSMVMMTKDLPRPKDGLPMNRSEVHFGPFFPGLPGGLSIYFNLDGDTVVEAKVERGLFASDLYHSLPMKAARLPDFLACRNPLSPQSYRLLGQKALLDIAANNNGNYLSRTDVISLEKERIGSHLNWLAVFAKTIGSEWMHKEAVQRYHFHKREKIKSTRLQKFLDKIRHMPYLRKRLKIVNAIPEELLHHLAGPVAKAVGKKQDARLKNCFYEESGWEPVIQQENNAWGWLMVRLNEIEQSTALIQKIEEEEYNQQDMDFPQAGRGAAHVESPRGTLSLDVNIIDGKVEELKLKIPSQQLAPLVNTVAEGMELSDALVQIAGLDISPWEMEFNQIEKQL